jgi:hypothetical protein
MKHESHFTTFLSFIALMLIAGTVWAANNPHEEK